MIEIILGLVAITAAAAAALGFAEGRVPFPVGLETTGAIAALGVLLLAHGLYRIRLKRREEGRRHWFRSIGLMGVVLVLTSVLALVIPAIAPLLNVFRVAGFPLGYYMAAQGSLIGLVILLFVYAAYADSVDGQEGAEEE